MTLMQEYATLAVNPISFIVAPCGSRLGLTYGGNYERRILRSPSGDQTAVGRLPSRVYLPNARTFTRMVSHLVASLSGHGDGWTLRPNMRPSSTPTYRTRLGTHHSQYPTASRITTASSDTLQSHGCQCN